VTDSFAKKSSEYPPPPPTLQPHLPSDICPGWPKSSLVALLGSLLCYCAPPSLHALLTTFSAPCSFVRAPPMADSLQSAPPPPQIPSSFHWHSRLLTMACLFMQAWGWRCEKSSKQDAVEDDELRRRAEPSHPCPHSCPDSFSINF
jgi:hypothetical protein